MPTEKKETLKKILTQCSSEVDQDLDVEELMKKNNNLKIIQVKKKQSNNHQNKRQQVNLLM